MNLVQNTQKARAFTPKEQETLKKLGFKKHKIQKMNGPITGYYYSKHHKALNIWETVEIKEGRLVYSFDTNAYYSKLFKQKSIKDIAVNSKKLATVVKTLKSIK